MLCLSRKSNESLTIGKPGDVLTEPIVVTLVETRGNRARLGIDAQRDVGIVRSELPSHSVPENLTDKSNGGGSP